MKNVQLINATNQKQYTVTQLRREVRQMKRTVNYILDHSKGMLNYQNSLEFLDDFKYGEKGVEFKQNVDYMRKSQLKEVYNQLAQVINYDVETEVYHQFETKKDRDTLARINKARREANLTPLTMNQMQEYFNIKEKYGEFFDDKYAYREVVNLIKTNNRRGKKKANILDMIRETEKELQDANEPHTTSDVIARINQKLGYTDSDKIDPKTGMKI